MDLKQACDILGIGAEASFCDLRRAYRLQVRRWHPDRFVNDPVGRQRAEELLKAINEAYGFLQAELAGRISSPPSEEPVSPPAPPVSAPPPPADAAGGVRGKPSDPFSFSPAVTAFPLISFFTAWQNIIFMLLVVCTVSVSLQLHGTFFNGAGYLLRMLAVPFVFALICNVVYGGKRVLWGMYVVSVSLVGILVLLDSLRFRNDWHEAASYRYYSSPDAGVGGHYGSEPPAPQEQGAFSFPGRRAPSGPVPPVSPDVAVPAAPLAPVAPIAPAAPPAAPAR